MTHHDLNVTTIADALEHLTEKGFEGMARAVEILLNEAMKLERSEFLGAGPYERNVQRQGVRQRLQAQVSEDARGGARACGPQDARAWTGRRAVLSERAGARPAQRTRIDPGGR